MPGLVVLTDQVFPDTKIERAKLASIGASLEVLPDSSPETIRARAREADGILTTYAPLDAATIKSLKRCRIIGRYGIGVDNIDLEAAREHGVVVTNVPDYCVDEVADHTLALLLAAARKIVTGNEVVRSGAWGIAELIPIRRLRDRSLGLIGYGRIASAVGRRARSFGLEVSAYDMYVPAERLAADGVRARATLDELLAESDFVSVHLPLSPSTRELVDAEAIARMRRGSVLLNTSRGPIVSTDAVLAALRSGQLAAAGLDVFLSEPPDARLLREAPNLIATPHAAFYSEEAIRESQTKVSEAIVDVLTGKEPRYRIV